MLPPFLEYLSPGAVYVQAPTDLIFLCGGKTKEASAKILSIRDAFLKVPNNPATHGRQILLAEKVNTFHLSRPAYSDLLNFEIDFAQICDLILLFSESQGSIAELGAFSMVDEIAKKLLVVVRDYHLTDDSFIKLGPLQHLKLRHGEHSVFVINDDDTGIKLTSLKGLNLDVLRDRLLPAINERFETAREKTTFDPSRHGHIIKLMVGFIQEFGGLTAAELKELLAHFTVDIEVEMVDRLLLCAEAAGWIAREQRGFEFFYFAKMVGRSAVTLKFVHGAPIFNTERRRQIFRDHWQKTDPQRQVGIVRFAGAAQ